MDGLMHVPKGRPSETNNALVSYALARPWVKGY